MSHCKQGLASLRGDRGQKAKKHLLGNCYSHSVVSSCIIISACEEVGFEFPSLSDNLCMPDQKAE